MPIKDLNGVDCVLRVSPFAADVEFPANVRSLYFDWFGRPVEVKRPQRGWLRSLYRINVLAFPMASHDLSSPLSVLPDGADPSSSQRFWSQLYIELAYRSTKVGRFADAAAMLDRVAPDESETLVALALLRIAIGEVDAGQEVLSRLATPDDHPLSRLVDALLETDAERKLELVRLLDIGRPQIPFLWYAQRALIGWYEERMGLKVPIEAVLRRGGSLTLHPSFRPDDLLPAVENGSSPAGKRSGDSTTSKARGGSRPRTSRRA
ncbi:tetratricopeptide repeat protein [Sandaracinus amylolyticus]|uniref:tetratricopeptide repeat protein n=1 Tax=Sandaracinus amylolyticus TaxID=927083 RepID=UPI001F2A1D49|nr:tetratricopeptide repeat protein [Sandaracinus amylolyticus]UJR81506.1 Hypothetical protein I5071_35660 [Sandaracinus amylolyticus]